MPLLPPSFQNSYHPARNLSRHGLARAWDKGLFKPATTAQSPYNPSADWERQQINPRPTINQGLGIPNGPMTQPNLGGPRLEQPTPLQPAQKIYDSPSQAFGMESPPQPTMNQALGIGKPPTSAQPAPIPFEPYRPQWSPEGASKPTMNQAMGIGGSSPGSGMPPAPAPQPAVPPPTAVAQALPPQRFNEPYGAGTNYASVNMSKTGDPITNALRHQTGLMQAENAALAKSDAWRPDMRPTSGEVVTPPKGISQAIMPLGDQAGPDNAWAAMKAKDQAGMDEYSAGVRGALAGQWSPRQAEVMERLGMSRTGRAGGSATVPIDQEKFQAARSRRAEELAFRKNNVTRKAMGYDPLSREQAFQTAQGGTSGMGLQDYLKMLSPAEAVAAYQKDQDRLAENQRAMMGDLTSRRGQDFGFRGERMGNKTSRRGQDIEQALGMRGIDVEEKSGKRQSRLQRKELRLQRQKQAVEEELGRRQADRFDKETAANIAEANENVAASQEERSPVGRAMQAYSLFPEGGVDTALDVRNAVLGGDTSQTGIPSARGVMTKIPQGSQPVDVLDILSRQYDLSNPEQRATAKEAAVQRGLGDDVTTDLAYQNTYVPQTDFLSRMFLPGYDQKRKLQKRRFDAANALLGN